MGLRLPPGMIPPGLPTQNPTAPPPQPVIPMRPVATPAVPATAPAGTQMLTTEPSDVKATESKFVPEVKAAQMRDWTVPYLKTTRAALTTAQNDLNTVPEAIRKPFDEAIGEIDTAMEDVVEGLRATQASNLGDFEKEKAKIGWLSLAETLALNMTKVFAGIHGMRSGKDLTSGLAFNPYDWQKELQEAREELKLKNTSAQKTSDETLGLKRQMRKDKIDTRDASLRDKMQSIRDRINSLERREDTLTRESGNVEQFNVQQRQRAGEKTEELQTRVSEGEANRLLKEEIALMKAELDKFKAEKKAGEVKATEALKQEKEVEKEREGLVARFNNALDNTSVGMSKDSRVKGHGQIQTALSDAGATPAEVEEIMRQANTLGDKWFADRGTPETDTGLTAKSKKLLQTKLNELLARKEAGRGAAVQYTTVRRKADGKTITLPAAEARAYLSTNPDTFEVVSEGP